MIDSTQRFSNRADMYSKYRPGYPQDCIKFICDHFQITKNSVIADIGSGTGILSKLLLKAGCTVIGVEPNDDMRRMGRNIIKDDNFISIAGTGESTNLKNHSVDLVTVAQAFHWMDAAQTKQEFKRILKNEKGIAILWNVQTAESNFAKEYETIKERYGKNYLAIRKSHEPDLTEFFKPAEYKVLVFPHYIVLDRTGLNGLIQSSSFMPRPTDKSYNSMVSEVNNLFNTHQENGLIRINYKTQLHYGE